MPKTREEKRTAFDDGEGNLKLKRLIPVPGGAMELALVSEGANGRVFTVAKSDERPSAEGTPTVAAKGGTTTRDAQLPDTPDNPIGAGTDLTIPDPVVAPGKEGPMLTDATKDDGRKKDGGDKAKTDAETPWTRFKSLLGALFTAVEEADAEGEVAAKTDDTSFDAVAAVRETMDVTWSAESALYDVICNIQWSYSLTDEEKRAKLREAAQAFADHIADKLKTDGAPKDFGARIKAAIKSARAEAAPAIHEAVKAAFITDGSQTEQTEETDMNETQVREIAAKSAQDAVAPVLKAVGQLANALKAAGLPDNALSDQLAQYPSDDNVDPSQLITQGLAGTDALVAGKGDGKGDGKGGKPAAAAAKTDKVDPIDALTTQVTALTGAVDKMRSIIVAPNGEGGGSSPSDDRGLCIDALDDFDAASRYVGE